MRRKKISEIISNINSEYIEEAAVYTGKEKSRNHFTWIKWGVISACIALLILFGVGILQNINTHTVTLDNGDTIKFAKDKSSKTEVEAKIGAEERTLTEEEVQTLFHDLPVRVDGLFDLDDHKLVHLKGTIGDVKLCVSRLGWLVSDTEITGYTDASIVDGVTVYAGYCYSTGKEKTIIYYATFNLGNSTVYVEHAGKYDDAKTLRNQISKATQDLIENGEINLEQITK